VSCIYLNARCSGALWHLPGGTLDGVWTTLLMTIGWLSDLHLRISQTERATANRHILSFSIQGMKTQSLPKSVRVTRGDVIFYCSFELAVPSIWISDGVSSIRESLRFWHIVLLVTEGCRGKSIALSVSLQILDLSLKGLINLGPIYREIMEKILTSNFKDGTQYVGLFKTYAQGKLE